MHDLSANQTRLLDALPNPEADPATPADLATASGLGYSTVTRLLRELAAAGLAAKDDQGWRAAAPVQPTSLPAAAGTEEPADDEPADAVTTDDAAGTERAPDEADDSVGEPAGTQDATERLTARAQEAHVEPEHLVDEATAQPAANSDAGTAPAGEAAAKPRMGKGQLRELVLTVLRADGGELGPTQIARKLHGRSQGAISNACDRLVEHGHAVLSSEKPRRYTATTAG
jgi:hypothetical protein